MGWFSADPTNRPLSEQIRAHPVYQAFMQQRGLLTRDLGNGVTATSSANSPVNLTDQQAVELELALRQAGIEMPKGYHIGRLGEVTADNHTARNFAIMAGGLVAAPFAASALGAAGAGGGGTGAGAAGTGAGAGAGTGAGLAAAQGLEAGAITGLGGSGFGAAAGGAGGAGSILAKAGKYSKALGPILSNAAGNQAAGRRFDEQTDLSRDRTALDAYQAGLAAPGKRLATSQKASILKNWSPVKSNWGGPGSVAKGQQFSYQGGYNNPDLIDPRTRQMANTVIDQQLREQLSGGGPPAPTPRRKSNAGEKILGGAAIGADILGGIYGR